MSTFRVESNFSERDGACLFRLVVAPCLVVDQAEPVGHAGSGEGRRCPRAGAGETPRAR